MSIRDYLNWGSIEKGLTVRHDRRCKFRLKRMPDGRGFHVYVLENTARNETIGIPRYLFDRFRGTMRDLNARPKEEPLDPTAIYFKNEVMYSISIQEDEGGELVIEESGVKHEGKGRLSLPRSALGDLDRLLYHANLGHPNDVLNRIITYHKLFQFSFTEATDSITSDLALRKDILSQVVRYVPSLGQRAGEAAHTYDVESAPEDGVTSVPDEGDGDHQGLFKSRLAERAVEKAYSVDYEQLFADQTAAVSSDPKAQTNRTRREKKAQARTMFPLPIDSKEIKKFEKVPFRCELSTEDIEIMRENFLSDRSSEIFLGFEIIDAIFRAHGVLKSFRFPLYYMRVSLKESGRHIYLEPEEDGLYYMNHLALATLANTFGRFSQGKDPMSNLFDTLLAQSIETDGVLSGISLTRHFPVANEVFEKTREVLLGFPGENGKGGILGGLRLSGIEADLDSVNLYKCPKVTSPVTQALERDLDEIMRVAVDDSKKFYKSLLGVFLSPETRRLPEKSKDREQIWIPGGLPKSTRNLMDKLERRDLVLLEGPPGTGKTFTIMNLLLQSICSGKRVLIVSDREGAVHALTEKIQDYLMGKDRDSPKAKSLERLWRTAIKVVDEIPGAGGKLSAWARDLRRMLRVDEAVEGEWGNLTDQKDLVPQLEQVDREIADIKSKIQTVMDEKLGPGAAIRKRVTPKPFHATTIDDIDSVVAMLDFVGQGQTTQRKLIEEFVELREQLGEANTYEEGIYDLFLPPEDDQPDTLQNWGTSLEFLDGLLDQMPRSLEAFEERTAGLRERPLVESLRKRWSEHFPASKEGVLPRTKSSARWVGALLHHPLKGTIRHWRKLVANHHAILSLRDQIEVPFWSELRRMHDGLKPDARPCLSLELCRFAMDSLKNEEQLSQTIQDHLLAIAKLQNRRDDLVRKRTLSRLEEIASRAHRSDEQGGTSPLTTMAAFLDAIADQPSMEAAFPALKDLQASLVEAFPIWICRKQAVSFLFPCRERSFDLVIVDEATQCRVDDALPLLFRACKLMVVGDEKQTVLAKNSPLDDYLFAEFELDEHLRTTQARGIKGGGSHIFGLVKAIKQASVMLDEHYRCPPDIIGFSNKYVYNGNLKTMQWIRAGAKPSVWVDHSEAKKKPVARRESGQYKGIETAMMDRFLVYVGETVKEIEKETGQKINMETDVALCYFLLKNEPYVKRVKGPWLTKLGRGRDVLDGAGAALQGKERDYIFYYWDVSRSNMMAFKQGDEEDKRKGELNVLMSRPKKRAYHFLHQAFADLDHHKASITDYLWTTLNAQSDKQEAKILQKRRTSPGSDFVPWRRSSGQLMEKILMCMLAKADDSIELGRRVRGQFGVAVGDPSYRVDLMLVPKRKKASAIGVVDLCGFEVNPDCAQNIVDYYFQLRRAQPSIEPVFVFLHELADPLNPAFHLLRESFERQLGTSAA